MINHTRAVVCHFNGSRFLITMLLVLALANASYGQQQKPQKKKAVQAEKQKSKVVFDLTDSLYLDSVAKVYGDSILVIVDSLQKDTTFLKSLEDPVLLDVGEFVSVDYKFQLPEKPTGWTNDYEGIFTVEQVGTLDSIISAFEAGTTNEIAVVTLPGSWVTTEKFDSMVLAIHNYWGVGKGEKNNGIVIGLSTGLRKIRISNGYGIEAKLSDSETEKIITNTIIPYFKKGNYFEGVRQGLLAIMQKWR